MQVLSTPLQGLAVVELDIYRDNRGFFVERFHAEKFRAAGLPTSFPQDNHSRSTPGVIRGLHCQHTPPQGKLVGVLHGSIWDVAVDIRVDSPTFGQHFGIELSAENGKLLWIPGGFAHGFCVLGEQDADVLYKVSAVFTPGAETGIAWNDPDLAINWPVTNPIISERDQKMQSFAEYKQNPPAW